MPPRRRRELPSLHRLPERSRQPFDQALGALKQASGWSYRDFAEQINAHADPGQRWNHAYLQGVVTGKERIVLPETFVALATAAARATGIEPTYFREYREQLAARKAAKLASEIGLDEVLAVLDELARRDHG